MIAPIFTDEEAAAVVDIVAGSWSMLAVRCAGAGAVIDNPFPRNGASRTHRRRAIAAAQSRRALLARALEKMTGAPVPEPLTDAFIRPYRGVGGPLLGRPQYVAAYAREEARRLAATVGGQLSNGTGG